MLRHHHLRPHVLQRNTRTHAVAPFSASTAKSSTEAANSRISNPRPEPWVAKSPPDVHSIGKPSGLLNPKQSGKKTQDGVLRTMVTGQTTLSQALFDDTATNQHVEVEKEAHNEVAKKTLGRKRKKTKKKIPPVATTGNEQESHGKIKEAVEEPPPAAAEEAQVKLKTVSNSAAGTFGNAERLARVDKKGNDQNEDEKLESTIEEEQPAPVVEVQSSPQTSSNSAIGILKRLRTALFSSFSSNKEQPSSSPPENTSQTETSITPSPVAISRVPGKIVPRRVRSERFPDKVSMTRGSKTVVLVTDNEASTTDINIRPANTNYPATDTKIPTEAINVDAPITNTGIPKTNVEILKAKATTPRRTRGDQVVGVRMQNTEIHNAVRRPRLPLGLMNSALLQETAKQQDARKREIVKKKLMAKKTMKKMPASNPTIVSTSAKVTKPPWSRTQTIKASNINLVAFDVEQPPVRELSYHLDRVLFSDGVHNLQDRRTGVFNYDSYLQNLMPVEEFDFDSLGKFTTSSKDVTLQSIAKKHGKRYVGSTSSMSSALTHFHYLLSNFRPLNLGSISRAYKNPLDTFTQLQRIPASIYLNYRDGIYAMDADKEFDSATVLSLLGQSMEKLLTLPKETYEQYRLSSPVGVPPEVKGRPEAYHYSSIGNFLFRSQLDAHHKYLPGTGIFDIKTRACVTVRLDQDNYKEMSGYQITGLRGQWESYEREYLDMLRSVMLKYSLQARLGRMDGIFVAYHNTEQCFGFQYIPLSEMDLALHGQEDLALGDQEFRLSMQIFSDILDKATKDYPEQSMRLLIETEPAVDGKPTQMRIFVEPMDEKTVDETKQTEAEEALKKLKAEVLGQATEVVIPSSIEAQADLTTNLTPVDLAEIRSNPIDKKSSADSADVQVAADNAHNTSPTTEISHIETTESLTVSDTAPDTKPTSEKPLAALGGSQTVSSDANQATATLEMPSEDLPVELVETPAEADKDAGISSDVYANQSTTVEASITMVVDEPLIEEDGSALIDEGDVQDSGPKPEELLSPGNASLDAVAETGSSPTARTDEFSTEADSALAEDETPADSQTPSGNDSSNHLLQHASPAMSQPSVHDVHPAEDPVDHAEEDEAVATEQDDAARPLDMATKYPGAHMIFHPDQDTMDSIYPLSGTLSLYHQLADLPTLGKKQRRGNRMLMLHLRHQLLAEASKSPDPLDLIAAKLHIRIESFWDHQIVQDGLWAAGNIAYPLIDQAIGLYWHDIVFKETRFLEKCRKPSPQYYAGLRKRGQSMPPLYKNLLYLQALQMRDTWDYRYVKADWQPSEICAKVHKIINWRTRVVLELIGKPDFYGPLLAVHGDNSQHCAHTAARFFAGRITAEEAESGDGRLSAYTLTASHFVHREVVENVQGVRYTEPWPVPQLEHKTNAKPPPTNKEWKVTYQLESIQAKQARQQYIAAKSARWRKFHDMDREGNPGFKKMLADLSARGREKKKRVAEVEAALEHKSKKQEK